MKTRGERFLMRTYNAMRLAALIAIALGLRARAAAAAAPDPLARADAAYEDGERERAMREYKAVLDQDAGHSRALFRLGLLHKGDPRAALAYFERYTRSVPRDPWGHMAVGDMLAALQRTDEALAAFDRAARLRPGERDEALGRARVLTQAARLEAAIDVLQAWLKRHPSDVEATRDLGRIEQRAGRLRDARQTLTRAQAISRDQRTAARLIHVNRAAAPALLPIIGGSSDSDGNHLARIGVDARLGHIERHTPGVRVEQRRASDGVDTRRLLEAAVHDGWRPRSDWRVESEVGLSRLAAYSTVTTVPAASVSVGKGRASRLARLAARPPSIVTVSTPGATFLTGALNVRYRATGDGWRVSARMQRRLLDQSLLLLDDRLMRSDGQLQIETPRRGRLGLRAHGRAAWLRGDSEDNRRLGLLVGPTWLVRPNAEIAFVYQRAGYAHPSAAGYFAPRLAELIECGSYIELEGESPWHAELDLGAGLQRSAEHFAEVGPWKPSLRAWSAIGYRLAPGRELRLEVDAYSGQPSLEVATVASWRSLAIALNLAWSF